MGTPAIPAFTLARLVDKLGDEIRQRWADVLADQAFVGGREVQAFERDFAAYLGVADCVAVANGTDALTVALRALGLKPGDEVIVPSFTFIGTAGSVVWAGGRPVFADVEPDTLNIDPESVASRIGPKTVGVIGVHLFGRPFDLDGLEALCEENDLWLLEDAAQAHGASWKGRHVGTFAGLATWSYYPSKNLGAFGDAGAITGADPDLVAHARRIANHGRTAHYEHAEVGTNSRMDGLQAAVLNVRLPHLEADNARRGEIACTYHGMLGDLDDMRLLEDREGVHAVYHQYAIRTSRRDALQAYLSERGIGTGIHYPMPLHRQPAFAPFDPADCPEAEAASREILSLPMFPELTNDEVKRVGTTVREFFEE
jgi:dTDP-4-amino-4,6-dideoxygalactose transaminase